MGWIFCRHPLDAAARAAEGGRMSTTSDKRVNDEYIAAMRQCVNQALGGVDYLGVSKVLVKKLNAAYAENEQLREALKAAQAKNNLDTAPECPRAG